MTRPVESATAAATDSHGVRPGSYGSGRVAGCGGAGGRCAGRSRGGAAWCGGGAGRFDGAVRRPLRRRPRWTSCGSTASARRRPVACRPIPRIPPRRDAAEPGGDDVRAAPRLRAPDPDAALRADIRRLGTLLGETLVRQEGQPLLDLVEEVRGARSAGRRAGRAAELRRLLADGVTTAHRSWPAPSPRTSTWPTSPSRCTGPASCAAAGPARAAGWTEAAPADRRARACRPRRSRPPRARLAVRPVFTAHPTEAARRSILAKLRAVADELTPRPAAAALLRRRAEDRPTAGSPS